jgi:hypothetical protein
MKYIATVLFACAVLHTFCVKWILSFAHRFPEGSIGENLLHFLGEIEVVFGLWAAIFIGIWSVQYDMSDAAHYLQGINYTEAAFVFVIMCMAATKPILYLAERSIATIAHMLPLPSSMGLYMTSLIVGPLLGSLITEPAAMTVTALLLRDRFFNAAVSTKFRYATIGLLFVNISIGGTLTHFAAPPVLMVAGPWQWDSVYMLTHFGWRAALAVCVGTVATSFYFRKELLSLDSSLAANEQKIQARIPAWVIAIHLVFMVLTIMNAHYIAFFIGFFLFFLGWCSVSKEYQDEIRIKESLLVGFFLAGLVTLGKLQDWWLQPLISQLGDLTLFWGALALTAVTDNAALTYLGTLVPDLSATARYALVAGAVAGGGLTVIANAPNPPGYGLLKNSFGADGISPLGLLLGALPFTILAAMAFLI